MAAKKGKQIYLKPNTRGYSLLVRGQAIYGLKMDDLRVIRDLVDKEAECR